MGCSQGHREETQSESQGLPGQVQPRQMSCKEMGCVLLGQFWNWELISKLLRHSFIHWKVYSLWVGTMLSSKTLGRRKAKFLSVCKKFARLQKISFNSSYLKIFSVISVKWISHCQLCNEFNAMDFIFYKLVFSKFVSQQIFKYIFFKKAKTKPTICYLKIVVHLCSQLPVFSCERC